MVLELQQDGCRTKRQRFQNHIHTFCSTVFGEFEDLNKNCEKKFYFSKQTTAGVHSLFVNSSVS
jgi:hypothetical protein